MSKNHGLWMILGCTLPLLLIFVLPLFGISGGTSLFIFIILMFACHLLMMGSHGDNSEKSPGEEHQEHKKEGGSYGCH